MPPPSSPSARVPMLRHHPDDPPRHVAQLRCLMGGARRARGFRLRGQPLPGGMRGRAAGGGREPGRGGPDAGQRVLGAPPHPPAPIPSSLPITSQAPRCLARPPWGPLACWVWHAHTVHWKERASPCLYAMCTCIPSSPVPPPSLSRYLTLSLYCIFSVHTQYAFIHIHICIVHIHIHA